MKQFILMQSKGLKRSAGWLASLAFCLQLALSLGHLHRADLFGPLGHPVIAGEGADRLAAPHAGPGDPSDNTGGLDSDADHCAVCASLHLTASAVPPVVAPAIFAAVQADLRPVIRPLRARVPAAYHPAHPRAPPTA